MSEICNILLLGETGVGKSTFINAFANYAKYENLEEAEINELICLIPTTFTYTDDDFETHNIALGEDHESSIDGQLATQNCAAHYFSYNTNKTICLIDTPGLCDTRGVNHDKANIDKLFSFIAKHKPIHGVIIVLKSNNMRIHDNFESSFKTIISRFNSDSFESKPKLFFLLTNGNRPFYRIGDTAKPMEKLLEDVKKEYPAIDIAFNKENVFCIDNKPFRYLAAHKNNIQMSSRKIHDQSWRISAQVCLHLLAKLLKIDDMKSELLQLGIMYVKRNIDYGNGSFNAFDSNQTRINESINTNHEEMKPPKKPPRCFVGNIVENEAVGMQVKTEFSGQNSLDEQSEVNHVQNNLKQFSFNGETKKDEKGHQSENGTYHPLNSKKLNLKKNNKGKNEKIYNILLLGETGVGKSTFINAFANYLNFTTLDDARKNDLICLIPACFTVTTEDFEQKKIQINHDPNEIHEDDGQSATQGCMAYVFQFRDYKIRFIDTPGIGDTRGIDQDKENFENILGFISNYKELHAICILLKPNNARLNVTFEFCLKQLLTHLEKSASQNIMFLFTNTRSTFYRPGETMVPLKKMLDEAKNKPPFVNIPYKDTIYCFDNEAFRFLVASKKGIFFKQEEQLFEKSWEKSVDVCVQLIDRIVGVDGKQCLAPHKVLNTISVNAARRLIIQLAQPLADIAKNIQDNLNFLNLKQNEINENVRDIEELNAKLFVPILDLEMKKLAEPTTVCIGPKCRQIDTNGNIQKYRIARKCHDPCYCKVKKNIFGKQSVKNCAVMGSDKKCRECNCKYKLHIHIYYETQVVKSKIMGDVTKAIQTKEEAKKKVEDVAVQLRGRSMLLKEEKRVILNSTGKFAHYLKNNAITPYNDTFEEYMKHLIENERINGESNNAKELEQMLATHEQEKKILDDAMASKSRSGTTSDSSNSQVTTDQVFDIIEKLFNLPIMGAKIKESFNVQEKARMRENVANREFNVPKAVAETKFTKKT